MVGIAGAHLEARLKAADTSEGSGHMAMNRLACGILAAVQLAGTWMALAQTSTDLGAGRQAPVIPGTMIQATVPNGNGTSPAITISARTLDFGAVPVGSNNERSFKIQNVGAGILTGRASVSPPFSILGDSAFVLKPAQSQLITVQYAPTSTGMHMTVVRLTGASVTVVGSTAPSVPKPPARRRRAPTQPDGLRLIARQ